MWRVRQTWSSIFYYLISMKHTWKFEILVSKFMSQVYLTFSLLLKIYLTKPNLIFREKLFRRTGLLLVTTSKSHVFLIKISSFHTGYIHLQRKIMVVNYWWILNVIISILLKKGWFTMSKCLWNMTNITFI